MNALMILVPTTLATVAMMTIVVVVPDTMIVAETMTATGMLVAIMTAATMEEVRITTVDMQVAAGITRGGTMTGDTEFWA